MSETRTLTLLEEIEATVRVIVREEVAAALIAAKLAAPVGDAPASRRVLVPRGGRR